MFHVQCTRNTGIAESRKALGKRSLKCNWGGWVSEITQCPFGWSKLEPSALALNRMWGCYCITEVYWQSRLGVVFTLFDRPSCVVVVKRKCRCDVSGRLQANMWWHLLK